MRQNLLRGSSLFVLVTLSALCPLGAAWAGPYDVGTPSHLSSPRGTPSSLRAPIDRTSVGTLRPDQILQPEAPEPDPVAPAPPPPAPAIDVQSPSGIDVADTSEADLLDRIGTLSGKTAFDPSVWQYLTAAEADTLLAALPTPVPAGALRESLISLLLTAATAPRDLPHDAAGSWLAARVRALIRIGAPDQAAALMAQLPPNERSGKLLAPFVLSQLLAGNPSTACDAAGQQTKAPASIRRLQLFCMAYAGRADEAELALSLRAEAGKPYDEWFTSLIEAMQYPASRLRALPESPTPLDLAMVFAGISAKQLPKGVSLASFASADYQPYHPLLMTLPHALAADRTLYMEALIESGMAVKSSDLEASYRAVLLKGEAAPDALADRAHAYDRLVNAPNTKTALRDMNVAMKAFAKTPRVAQLMLAAPLRVLSQTMRPEQPYLAYAPQAFALLLSAGAVEDTGKWLRMMDVHRESSPATYVAHELARFAAGNSKHLSAGARQLPPIAIPDDADRDELRLLQRYFRMIVLFGYHTPELSTGLLDEQLEPITSKLTPWPMETLKPLAEQGSVAGVLLASTAFLKQADWREVSDDGLQLLLESLLAAGKKEQARALLIESLLVFF